MTRVHGDGLASYERIDDHEVSLRAKPEEYVAREWQEARLESRSPCHGRVEGAQSQWETSTRRERPPERDVVHVVVVVGGAEEAAVFSEHDAQCLRGIGRIRALSEVGSNSRSEGFERGRDVFWGVAEESIDRGEPFLQVELRTTEKGVELPVALFAGEFTEELPGSGPQLRFAVDGGRLECGEGALVALGELCPHGVPHIGGIVDEEADQGFFAPGDRITAYALAPLIRIVATAEHGFTFA